MKIFIMSLSCLVVSFSSLVPIKIPITQNFSSITGSPTLANTIWSSAVYFLLLIVCSLSAWKWRLLDSYNCFSFFSFTKVICAIGSLHGKVWNSFLFHYRKKYFKGSRGELSLSFYRIFKKFKFKAESRVWF